MLDKKIRVLKKSGRLYDRPYENILVYHSKGGNSRDNFNSQVDARGPECERVQCRHLAYFFVRYDKSYHHRLRSMKSIGQETELTNCAFDREKIHFQSKEYIVIPLNALGSHLYAIGQSLKDVKKSSQRTKKFLLSSESHAMAIVVRSKKDGSYIIKFYDPNETTVHIRVLSKNLEALKQLSIENFLSQGKINTYFPQFKTIVIFSHDKREREDLVKIKIDEQLDLESVLFFALTLGFSEQVSDVCQKIKDNSQIGLTKKAKLLAAKYKMGLPAFYATLAFSNGRSGATVKAFVKGVIGMTLSNEQKIEILAAKSLDGVPAFYFTLKSGLDEKVEVFVKGVIGSELSDEQKMELLASKDTNGFPGFYFTFSYGLEETVKVFMEGVIGSKLSDEQKMELLTAKDPDGVPAFFFTLRDGLEDTVKVFMEGVIGSKLSDEQKIELLTPKDSAGVPAFYYTLSSGLKETVKIFVEGVLGAGLSDEQKMELLTPKDMRGASGFCYTLGLGFDETVKVFMGLVIGSDLSNELKVQLLAPKDSDGVPALSYTLSYGHDETVKIFMNGVIRSDLSNELKVQLLAPKDPDGIPAFYHALVNSELAETMSLYLKEVIGSTLSNKQKIELLTAKDADGVPAFFLTLSTGLTASVKAFLKGVIGSDLPNEQKMELLTPKGQVGEIALFLSITNGHKKTVQAYVQEVLRSDLSNAHKRELLDPINSLGQSCLDLLDSPGTKFRKRFKLYKKFIRKPGIFDEKKDSVSSDVSNNIEVDEQCRTLVPSRDNKEKKQYKAIDEEIVVSLGTSSLSKTPTKKLRYPSKQEKKSVRVESASMKILKGTTWHVKHKSEDHRHKFFYQEVTSSSDSDLDSNSNSQPCKLSMELQGDISYSSEEKALKGLVEYGSVNATESCTDEKLQLMLKDIGSRLPSYERRQQLAAVRKFVKELPQTCLETVATTGIILLIRDVMLSRGYSNQAAEWGSYLVNQAFNVARTTQSLWWGSHYVTAFLPLLTSNIVYHGLSKTGLTSKRTASWCSSATSAATSWYTGSGLFNTVASLGLGNFVSYATSLGEEKFANAYLTKHLKVRCTQLESEYSRIKAIFPQNSLTVIRLEIDKLINRVEAKATMQDYAVVSHLQEKLTKIRSNFIEDHEFTAIDHELIAKQYEEYSNDDCYENDEDKEDCYKKEFGIGKGLSSLFQF